MNTYNVYRQDNGRWSFWFAMRAATQKDAERAAQLRTTGRFYVEPLKPHDQR